LSPLEWASCGYAGEMTSLEGKHIEWDGKFHCAVVWEC